jgi:hypothetical protein
MEKNQVNLKDFISQAIIDICDGVADAKEDLLKKITTMQ